MIFLKLKILFITLLTAAILFSSCAAPEIEIPKGMKLFSNDLVEYTAFVPEKWVVSNKSATISAYASVSDASSVVISSHPLGIEKSNYTAKDYWADHEKELGSLLTDIEYSAKDKAKKLDKQDAMRYVYTAKLGETEYKYMQTVCIKDETVFLITYTSTPELYAEHTEEIEKILDNFKFN